MAGFSYLQIGADTIDTFYIGDLQIEALYFGEEQIYGSGPFVGLKATKTLSFNPNQLTGTLKIKSSENWSLTDNSTVGSYYTLENFTNGCDGWIPTYDGSLDGGELSEHGLWFEWQEGVSQTTFQEYLDTLAAYGITATGSYCSDARYSIYLNPHSTGGPGWLSYSQTTGGTGETIVTVTASTAQAARTATITTSSANYTATTNVTQSVFVDKDLFVTGRANIVTDFNPYTFFTGNSNYMKIEICHQFTNIGNYNRYLYSVTPNWFSLETSSQGPYFNIGSNAGVVSTSIQTTQGLSDPMILIITGNNVTLTIGGNTQNGTYSGTIPNGVLVFYPNTYALNYAGHLYEMKVYGQNDVLAHWYAGYQDGNVIGIEDRVTGNKFQPNGSNYTIQLSDL